MFSLAVLLALATVAVAAPQERIPPQIVPMHDGRIVGGVDTDISRHPYIASLVYLGSHRCGAARISSTWLLTAAHCVQGINNIGWLQIRAGSTYRTSGGQLYSLSRVVIHPGYSSWTIDNDIASLQTTVPITVANSADIPLPALSAGPAAGSPAIITGWGALTEGGSSPVILQEVEVPVVSQQDCRAAYGTSSITNQMFCVGLLGVGGKDACQGDSGGPVVVRGVLVGLVSWGRGCAQANFPGVKTNVPALMNWVWDNTGVRN